MYETYTECRERILSAPSEGRISDGFSENNNKILNCDYASIGLRIPFVKKLACFVPLSNRDEVMSGFFADGDLLFEKTLFAGCLGARKGDYDATREYMRRIIPLFGSWAHTDSVVPCLRWTDTDAVLDDFSYLLRDGLPYGVRFYIIYIMNNCLAGMPKFALDTLKNDVRFGEYYVDMAAAWLIAESLVKQYSITLPYLEGGAFPPFVHNMAIKKARESFRISADRKSYLSALKIRAE